MIHLTAQPDDYYFTWQLELQINNLFQLGLSKENIHVLIAYNAKLGLQRHFQKLIDSFQEKASFFVYQDNRINRNYASSIRPHIISQHLTANPDLQEKSFFYHDSDVIFRVLPDYNQLLYDEVWYVSDTRDYLDSQYLLRSSGESLFNEMCEIVGVTAQQVSSNDQNCGGAQYLLKNTTVEFWDKVEADCEKLYVLMEDFNAETLEFGKVNTSTNIGVQSWCADMWAIFWNALFFGYSVKIHEELDFCWPTNNLSAWENKKILHYSGVSSNAHPLEFCKGIYVNHKPYYDADLKKVNQKSCSKQIVELINSCRALLDDNRVKLVDVSFLIPVKIDSQTRLENVYAVVNYLDKYFNTNIIIMECDQYPKIDASKLPDCSKYIFRQQESEILHHTKINNLLVKESTTEFIAIYDTDVVFPINQIVESVEHLRCRRASIVYPYDGRFVTVDSLLKQAFCKILDPEFFVQNIGKCLIGTERSRGGAAFLNRKDFIDAGMDNEFFTSWGPEDIERFKRMKNLGYRSERVEGPLFHLFHETGLNSDYIDIDAATTFMKEYLSICNMDKERLIAYVSNWPWIN